MQYQMGYLSREVKPRKKKGNSRNENTITDIKKDFYEFISGLNTANGRINELEDRLIEIIQTEKEKQYNKSSSNNDNDNDNKNNSKRKKHTEAPRHYQKA